MRYSRTEAGLGGSQECCQVQYLAFLTVLWLGRQWNDYKKSTQPRFPTARQSDYPYSKGVDVLLIPQNFALAQHLVGGVPNLFPTPLLTCTMKTKTSHHKNLQGASKMLKCSKRVKRLLPWNEDIHFVARPTNFSILINF